MCSSCKMDPRDVKIMRERQGAMSPEYGEVEVNYKPKAKKKKAFSRYPGCPGNEGKAHVYVWTTELNKRNFFADFYGFEKYEKKVCAGCRHRDTYRRTEEYNRRNEKAYAKRGPRRWSSIKWYSFEDDDEAYRERREVIMKRQGWSEYLYSSWWAI